MRSGLCDALKKKSGRGIESCLKLGGYETLTTARLQLLEDQLQSQNVTNESTPVRAENCPAKTQRGGRSLGDQPESSEDDQAPHKSPIVMADEN